MALGIYSILIRYLISIQPLQTKGDKSHTKALKGTDSLILSVLGMTANALEDVNLGLSAYWLTNQQRND